MADSTIKNDENKKNKVIEEKVTLEIREDSSQEMIDVSENLKVNNTSGNNINISNSEANDNLSPEVKTDAKKLNASSNSDDGFENKKSEKGKEFLNEARNMFNDSKNPKNTLNPGQKLGEKPNTNQKNDNKDLKENGNNSQKQKKENSNPALDKAKDAAKDATKEAAKQVADKALDTGKKAASKAIGTAGQAVGIPQPVGEFVSKKVLDGGEKLIKKKTKNVANKVKNSETLKKVKNKGKKAVDTGKKTVEAVKFVKKAKVIAPIVLGVLAVGIVISLVVAASEMIQSYLPGAFGDVKKEVEAENYSKRDEKILDKIDKINKKYPNADGAVVMAAISYPHYELIQSNEIKTFSKEEKETTEKTEEEEETESFFELNESAFEEDDLSISEEEDELEVENDPYLNIFSKYKYRKKYEELMKVYNEKGEEGFETYLKEEYIPNDDDYKKLVKDVSTEDETEVNEIIASDIVGMGDLFSGYIMENQCITGSTFSSGGQVTVDNEVIKEMMQGNVLIDLLAPGCGDINKCESHYSTPLTLDRYIKGVTYQELGTSNDPGQIGAQMVAAKSFILSKHLDSVTKTADGVYVVKASWGTADQDFCDYQLGCKDIPENIGYNNIGNCIKLNCKHHWSREPASVEKQALYDQVWEETKNYYIMKDGIPTGNYYGGYPDDGTGMDHVRLLTLTGMNYKDVLQTFYYNCEFYVVEGEFMSLEVASPSNACATGNGGIADDQFIYYNQNDYLNAYCGRTDGGTIKSSGCGITAMAMVLANLTYENTIDPVYTMNEAHAGGYCGPGISGTYASYFPNAAKKHNLTMEYLSEDAQGAAKAIEILKQGGLVIVNVNAASPFTNYGHYIVIRKVEGDGTIYVADPNHPELFNQPYNISDFYTKDWFASGSWQGFIGPRSAEIAASSTVTGVKGESTGYLGNPIRQDNTENFMNQGNAKAYPYYNDGGCHGAVDIALPEGTTVYAMDGGTVIRTNDYNGSCNNNSCKGYDDYGNLVVIDHGNGYTTWYAHLKQRKVNQGDKIAKGQLIGYTGNTGHSTGPHIHLELQKTDLLNANGGRANAKCSIGKGLLNPAKYINSTTSYVGKTE